MPRASLSQIEIAAPDPARAAAFFRQVYGWEAVAVPWDGPTYVRMFPPEPSEPVGAGILHTPPMSPTRRHFIGGLSTALAATWTETLRAASDPKKDVVIVHGSHRYKVNKEWVPASQGRHHPILNCHEMVQVKDGRLFMVGDHSHNQMLVFKPDGTILESWGGMWPGGHGLSLSNENGEEFLFVTDSGLWKSGNGGYRQTGRVTKTDLTGKEIFSISHPR